MPFFFNVSLYALNCFEETCLYIYIYILYHIDGRRYLIYTSWYAEFRLSCRVETMPHNDVFKWKHFPRYCPFVRGIHRSPVNSPHKGQWRGALMLALICARIDGWVNNREAGDLKRHCAHYDVTVMWCGLKEALFCPSSSGAFQSYHQRG